MTEIRTITPQEITAGTNGNHNGYHPEYEVPQPLDVEAFLERHPNFVPTQYDPRVHGVAIQQFMFPGEVTDDTALVDTNVGNGERLSYNGKFSRFEEEVAELIMRTGVYNTPVGEDGKGYNVAIEDPEAAAIRQASLEALRTAPIEVIAPFAEEPESIQGVIGYLSSRVGMDRVHPVDAGIHAESGELARETGANVLNQQNILKYVDLQKLMDIGVIPQIDKLKGSKGLTMFAGNLALAAQGKLGGYVAYHDTDIVNPDEYAALDYLGIPFAFPVGEMNGVYIGRTGAGRNNESLQGENMHNLSKRKSAEVRRIAHNFAPIMWPLTGERIVKGDVIANMPWPVDMNIETMIDFTLAGLNAEAGEQRLMQVANPTQKEENRVSTDPREWGMIYGCEKSLRTYYEMFEDTGRMPHQWGVEDVARYNKDYGNFGDNVMTKGEIVNQPNTLQRVARGVMMPSINQLIELGVFDIEGLRQELMQRN
ncbi:hypothetical protein IPM65_04860 [Candidatus Roizmanbacteria bacterium]|nr:MAG: hypothetical protein IPM65_04860 [Candidatus Roizmanbacteria bacterium]